MAKAETAPKTGMIIDLTRGPIASVLIKLTVPFMLSNLLQTLYSMVDMIVVGQIVGSSGLSAVTISSQLIMLMTTLVMGFASGGQILISQLSGVKDHRGISETTGTLFTTVGVVGLCMSIIGILVYEPVFRILNMPPEAWDQGRDYMIICAAGNLFTCGYITVSAILRGMGDAQRPLVFIAIASIVNIILDLLFVGVFDMKAAGAAWATIIAQAVSFIVSIIYLYRRREKFGFDFKLKSFKVIPAKLKILTKLGVPLALSSSAINISMLFVSSYVNGYGLAASSTFGVGRRIEQIPGMLTQSVSMACSSMIGQNMAAGKVDRAKKTIYIAIAINVVVYAIALVLFLLFPQQIFGIFTSDAEVIDYAPMFMRTIIVAFPAFIIMHGFNPFIQGIGNATLSMVLSILDGVVARLSLAVILGNAFGLEGLFYGYCLAAYVNALLGAAYYYSGLWKKRKLLVDTKSTDN